MSGNVTLFSSLAVLCEAADMSPSTHTIPHNPSYKDKGLSGILDNRLNVSFDVNRQKDEALLSHSESHVV